MKTSRNYSASQVGLGLVAGSLFASALYVSGCSSEFRRCEVTRTCAAAGKGNVGEAGEAGDSSGVNGGGGSGGSAGISGAPHLGGANAGGEAGTGVGEGGDAGAGVTSDPCTGVVCASPPDSECVSASKFRAYDAVGSCSAGECSYAAHDIACTCMGSACTTDPCIGVTCNAPPASKCLDADTLTKYASSGTCSVGSCSYGTIDVPCSFGCANGACKADPCAGVTCNVQKASTCKNVTTVETYAASGTCSKGACSYAPTDTACPTNKACGGAGVCNVCKSDASCGDTCAACPAATPKCKDLGTTSKCIACYTDTECGLGVCDVDTNACQPSPTGCNVFAQLGAVVNSTTGTGGTLPAATRGAIIPGTYVFTAYKTYGQGGGAAGGETLAIAVAGNKVTINSYQNYLDNGGGYHGPLRSTYTFDTTGAPITYQYTCIAPNTLQLPPPATLDYSVVNATTLQLIYSSGSGNGGVATYTKQ